ncbi:MAG: hypothetical protein PSX80_06940, partial [bacterium]|nr:hypothetical protein [bacterium]
LRKASEGGRVRSTITTTAGNSWTQLAVSDNADSISTICSWPGCSYYSYDDEFQSNAAVSNIDVAYNGSSFTVSVTLLQGSDTEAKELSGIFSEALKIGSCSDDYATSAQQVVYRYSVSKPGNGQVLIVTRLPRAGLDALLAKDAK